MQGTVVVKQLDLTDLASVRACSKDILATERVPDGLLLNAGIMACPLARTADGFESQIASNFIGHFLFAGSGIVKAMVKQVALWPPCCLPTCISAAETPARSWCTAGQRGVAHAGTALSLQAHGLTRQVCRATPAGSWH